MASELRSVVLRKLYAEILRGHSIGSFSDEQIYVRHFSPIEQGTVDNQYVEYYNKAVQKGLPKEEDKLASLKASKLWTKEDEDFIENQRSFILNLGVTKTKLAYEAQIQQVNKEIREAEKLLHDKVVRRVGLMGMTAESYASKKLNEAHIFYSLFKDKSFNESYFTVAEFDNLENSELSDLIFMYNKIMKSFNTENLQSIALAPFFQNYFMLCDDNIYSFYGRPIVDLTFFQSELASYGRQFRHILSADPRPPADLLDDPIKLIDWYHGTQNMQKIVGTQESVGTKSVALVGASEKDMKAAGAEDIKSLAAIAGEKKTLSMEELMNLQS